MLLLKKPPYGFKDNGKGLNQNRAKHISHDQIIKSTVNKQVKHVHFVMACMGYGIAKHFLKELKEIDRWKKISTYGFVFRA